MTYESILRHEIPVGRETCAECRASLINTPCAHTWCTCSCKDFAEPEQMSFDLGEPEEPTWETYPLLASNPVQTYQPVEVYDVPTQEPRIGSYMLAGVGIGTILGLAWGYPDMPLAGQITVTVVLGLTLLFLIGATIRTTDA